MNPVLVLGGGGHALVVARLLDALDRKVAGFCDPDSSRRSLGRYRRLGSDDVVEELGVDYVDLANGLGFNGQVGRKRRELFERLLHSGFAFPALVHPAAWVDALSTLGAGTVVMAGAVVQPGSKIGLNVVVNTGARIDHTCRIGNHVHVAPGAVLAGDVTVSDGAFIGAGATVIEGITVGQRALVGAGAVVVRDVAPGTVVVGIPARERE